MTWNTVLLLAVAMTFISTVLFLVGWLLVGDVGLPTDEEDEE